MSNRYKGGFITAAEPTVNVVQADGVWTVSQQFQYQGQGTWPVVTFPIARSLRFNSADSAYLSKAFAANSDATKATLSFWHKRSVLATEQQLYQGRDNTVNNNNRFFVSTFQDNIYIRGYDSSANLDLNLITTAVYRDVSSWYHILVVLDTTQATSSDRVKLYVNGELVTSFSSSTYPSLNQTFRVANSVNTFIGSTPGGSAYLNGYLAGYYFLDGIAASVTDFGATNATTGVWGPIAYSGTYGTNGFFLPFINNSSTTTLGTDYSGNGNNWTLNNFSVTAGAGNDSLVDTPTPYGTDTGAGGEVRGNYPTINPTFQAISNNSGTLSNGNLQIVGTSLTYFGFYAGTFAISSDTSQGYYFEYTQSTYANDGSHVGFYNVANFAVGMDPANSFMGGATTNTYGICYTDFGYLGNLGSQTTGLTTWKTNGDVVGVAIKDNKVWFSKNGAWISGDPAAGTSPSATFPSARMVYPVAGTILNNVNHLNFGQRPFAYTAPSGFKALVTTNLPEPTVVQGDDYFNTVLYTGTGASQSITGVGFQPDWVWIKERNGAADHGLYDAVRGVQQQLESNTTTAETTESTGLTAFGSDGFTVGALAQLNTSADTYVAWNWNAGGSNATNTDGTITSTVRANPTAGFSVVTWSTNASSGNATVGHGLGTQPKFIIMKSRNNTYNWDIYAGAISNAKDGRLTFTTAAFSTASVPFGNTDPTSSVFTMSQSFYGTGIDCVAYCFAEVPGYSAFGKYTGNGSTDGPFVYTGFRPAFVMYKNASAVADWIMVDNLRDPYNVTGNYLRTNTDGAESADPPVFDFTANGFKVRRSTTGTNGSGNTIIYAAFAENPFKYSLAR
jgi:hypothetical protein